MREVKQEPTISDKYLSVRVPDQLHTEIKVAAAKAGTSVQDWVTEACRTKLNGAH